MRNMRFMAVFVVIIGLVASVAAAADVVRFALASGQDLVRYPGIVPVSERQDAAPLYAVVLPGTSLVVIIRPLTESEYGSFQVQAISAQMIEQQMLVAAIVLPLMNESDVAALSKDLVALLERQVNEISGFDVFTVLGN